MEKFALDVVVILAGQDGALAGDTAPDGFGVGETGSATIAFLCHVYAGHCHALALHFSAFTKTAEA